MQEKTGFGKKDCVSVPGLAWKYFSSLRTEEDEPIYSYNDKYMTRFGRQSIKGGRVFAFNQYYKSKFCDVVLNHTSKELFAKGNIYDFFEAYLIYKNTHLESTKTE